jgi:hypothetical protein
VTDATRIERLAPTIEMLLDRGAKLIVIAFRSARGNEGPGVLPSAVDRALEAGDWRNDGEGAPIGMVSEGDLAHPERDVRESQRETGWRPWLES